MGESCTCCKDCEKRQVGCHTYCQDYIRYKEDHDRMREEHQRKRKELNDDPRREFKKRLARYKFEQKKYGH